jgi:mono/diheme cytochrome c family protein
VKRWLFVVLAFGLGLILTPALVYGYIAYGRPPVSVSDAPFPMEKQAVRVALHKRIDQEMEQSPLQPTRENLVAGAKIYRSDCAFCHGLPSTRSDAGRNMFPSAPQLWVSHKAGIVGVSDDPVGETYWRVKNGIRLTGMPAYQKVLSVEQMWQVSLLLSKANEPMSEELRAILVEQK